MAQQYDYEKLNSMFSLQRKEIERVLGEAQQALDNLEQNRYLLGQHQRLTLRLREINTRLSLVDSRLEEQKSWQRLAKIELEHLGEELQELASTPAQREGKTEPLSNPGTAQISQQNRLREREWRRLRRQELTDQRNEAELELVELHNHRLKLESQQYRFSAELNNIEQQLQARGIGPTQSLPSHRQKNSVQHG
ncbi:MAG TPA: hypothetical protein VH186_18615 [Chloroflexia bacterium]|nr:hypothetical protein [Chloroflexia bacterium]